MGREIEFRKICLLWYEFTMHLIIRLTQTNYAGIIMLHSRAQWNSIGHPCLYRAQVALYNHITTEHTKAPNVLIIPFSFERSCQCIFSALSKSQLFIVTGDGRDS